MQHYTPDNAVVLSNNEPSYHYDASDYTPTEREISYLLTQARLANKSGYTSQHRRISFNNLFFLVRKIFYVSG